ncbi:iron chelate uptake ABC transporter, permease [Alteracholeplasma palmae J233]|uniref:Iron chelate uptake ABC transporter, permease n=1 Tax=Alteracholeplasma palmae (strain ATCC 49389 / J233) TaxID=1318466 RepID=U4KKL8_ALTPJ|nr:iron chelate uptake ABC transporter family permease subunit [Alteracholeplasma palmae]CCV64153.1 iron chelate uptake ABC transporter, permease [Alteracholeplasma palmae J233]
MKKNTKYIILIALCVILMFAFLFVWVLTTKVIHPTPNVFIRILTRRGTQLIAILVSSILIATSSLIFQTITNNRILTPSVLGFDSIYVITQTLIVMFLGATSVYLTNVYANFSISLVAMVGITFLMYIVLLKKDKKNIILLLLVGMIISSLAGSITNFIQSYMNPDQFQNVSNLTTVSLNNINEQLIYLTTPIMIVLIVLMFKQNKYYDVMDLGEDTAISLGVNYSSKVNLSLVYIAIAVAISTALIGTLTFLGLIAVNSAREIFKTNNHKTLMIASGLMSIIFVLFGQIVTELLQHKTSVSVLINLIGGSYMIYLILRENKI